MEFHGEQKTICRDYRGSILGRVGENVIVRVVYSDETEGGKDSPIVLIAALVVNMDKYWTHIERDLEAIKSDTPKKLLHEGKELKGKNLYSALRKVHQLRIENKPIDPELEVAREILLRILMIPIKYPTPIFYGATDKVGYDNYLNNRGPFQKLLEGPVSKARHKTPTGYHLPDPPTSQTKTTAHDIAFDACLARVNATAESFLAEGERVLWIHDHRGDRRQEGQTRTGLKWAQYLTQQGWDLVNLGYIGEQEPLRVADSIYFGDSHESLALQLADICCSTIGFQVLRTLYGWRDNFSDLYAIIQRRVVNDGTPPMYREWRREKTKEPKS